MPKYNETSVVGESWKRAFQILIENFYNKPPKIRFSEEEIFVAADGRLAGSYNGEGIEEYFTVENANTQFQLRNPETEEYIDQYATYKDLQVLIHSLYFHLVKLRDRGPAPFGSWIYNEELSKWEAPVPKPTDGKEYVWNENTLSWDIFIPPTPYMSWTYNEELNIWEAPIPKPTDGKEYIWNDLNQQWDLID